MSLPNFFIIGAAKSGTTSLYHYLKQHPEIYMSPLKEPRFLAFVDEKPNFAGPGDQRHVNYTSVTDIDSYRALFSKVKNEKAIGEASVIYLYYYRTVPEQIVRYAPEARLIAMLRHPAESAFSSFLHLARDGHETTHDFARALELEDRRVADNWTPMWHYTRRGFYYEQLKRYYDVFGRERLAVFLYEDFKARPLDVLRDIYRFLGVDEDFTPDIRTNYNTSGLPKNQALHRMLTKPSPLKLALKPLLPQPAMRFARRIINNNLVRPQLAPDVRQRLIELYREDILNLQDLINRDLSAWLR